MQKKIFEFVLCSYVAMNYVAIRTFLAGVRGTARRGGGTRGAGAAQFCLSHLRRETPFNRAVAARSAWQLEVKVTYLSIQGQH